MAVNLPARIKPDPEQGKCQACGSALNRRGNETTGAYRKRKTCNPACAARLSAMDRRSPGEMIIANTTVSKLTGCWNWDLYKNRSGYGSYSEFDGESLAHRISYAAVHGPIPSGMQVLHKCDNPACCNVAHLFLGTNIDNVLDRVAKGRTASGERSGRYKHGKYVGQSRRPTADVRHYWESLEKTCVCGAPSEHIHHIIHLNGQRITKDDWLVIPLCHSCHNGSDSSVHALGGERQFLAQTGHDLVHRAVLNRHNYEVRFCRASPKKFEIEKERQHD